MDSDAWRPLDPSMTTRAAHELDGAVDAGFDLSICGFGQASGGPVRGAE